MSIMECEQFLVNSANYLENFEDQFDNTVSTISDCYSSDENEEKDEKEILQDCLSSQSPMILDNESFIHSQEEIDKISLDLQQDDKLKFSKEETTYRNDGSICQEEWNDSNYSFVPVSKQLSQPKSAEFIFNKSLSEFYRPPSISRNSLCGMKMEFGEHLSLSTHHYMKQLVKPTIAKDKKQVFESGLRNHKDNECFEEIGESDSFSDAIHLCHISNQDQITVNLQYPASINSQEQNQFQEQNQLGELNNTNSNCDAVSLTAHHHENVEDLSLCVPFRNPRINFKIKTTTQLFTRKLIEKKTQTKTSFSSIDKLCEDVSKYQTNVLNEKTPCLQNESNKDNSNGVCQSKNNEDINTFDYTLTETLTKLQNYVDMITTNFKKSLESNQNVIPMQVLMENPTNVLKDQCNDSEKVIKNLYKKIKHIFYQLDDHLKYEVGKKIRRKKHQRYFSELTRNRVPLSAGGDFHYVKEEDTDLDDFNGNDQESRSNCQSSALNPDSDLINLVESPDSTSRFFELNPYDELVKSFQSNTDRRIKAIANKMKCQIFIDGPYQKSDSSNSCWNVRNKVQYRCSLSGNTKELVEKCFKCLQDTFPQSFFKEKYVKKCKNA